MVDPVSNQIQCPHFRAKDGKNIKVALLEGFNLGRGVFEIFDDDLVVVISATVKRSIFSPESRIALKDNIGPCLEIFDRVRPRSNSPSRKVLGKVTF